MNRGNPAVKRILADVKELQRHPSSRYHAEPTEDNMFEWHFTIRGPLETDFAGGIYHGRILLPSEYPFKPPNIVFLTVVLLYTIVLPGHSCAYHPEHWQPAWGVRTMLEAIISFLPTEGQGAIGALDWTPRERRKLAEESVDFRCPVCGEVRDLLSEYDEKEDAAADPEIAAQVSQLHVHGMGSPDAKPSADTSVKPTVDENTISASVESHVDTSPNPVTADSVQPVENTSEGNDISAEPPEQADQEDLINRINNQNNFGRENRVVPQGGGNDPDYVDYVLLLLLGLLGVVICTLVVVKTTHLFDERDL